MARAVEQIRFVMENRHALLLVDRKCRMSEAIDDMDRKVKAGVILSEKQIDYVYIIHSATLRGMCSKLYRPPNSGRRWFKR